MIKDYEKVVVLTLDDKFVSLEEWQRQYGLTVGSAQIGKHFFYTESKFQDDLARYGKLVVCAPLMVVMDKYRELVDEPVNVNSYNRDEKKQEELREAGARAATHSPHVEKMAADLDTLDAEGTYIRVTVLQRASRATGIDVRIGFRQYLEQLKPHTFIHVDVCPMYYAKGKPRHNEPHPAPWESAGLTW